MGRSGSASAGSTLASGSTFTTLVAPDGGIAPASGIVFRDLVIDASGLTASHLFASTGVSNVVIENCRVTGLASTKGFASFTSSSNIRIVGCVVESGGKGITFDACDDVQAIGNDITLTTDSGSGFTGHGVLFYANTEAHSHAVIRGNKITAVATYAHGIYAWGSDASTLANPIYATDIVVTDNLIDTAQGGIWFSKCQRVSVTGNTLTGCNDVGIDFEGCLDWSATGNTLDDCKSGSLAALYNSKRGVFSGNHVTASSFTVALGGAGHLAETSWLCGYIRETCEDIAIVGNTFVSTGAGALGEINVFKNGESAACKRLTIKGNQFYNCAIFGVSQLLNPTVQGNDFYFDFEPSASVVEVDQSDGVVIRGNRLSAAADSAQNTRGHSPVAVYQSSAASTLRVTNVVIENNQILNFPSVGIEVDTYNGTNYTATMVIRNNEVGVIFIRTSAAATKLITGNTAPGTPQTANDTPTTW